MEHTIKSTPFWKSILFLVVGTIIVIGIWFSFSSFFQSEDSFVPNAYHAVFLTNNQVYFGMLSNSGSQYTVLTNVYYIQSLQSQDLSNGTKTASQMQLVKLGSELHEPQDTMYLNKDQILFIEPLKSDSKIVKAIESFKRGY